MQGCNIYTKRFIFILVAFNFLLLFFFILWDYLAYGK